MQIALDPHPLLDTACFLTTFPAPLSELPTPPWLSLQALDAATPLTRSDTVKAAVRDLFRHAGFKPTGRSKPASEYLIKAVEKGWLGPDKGINPAVDACNVVSLASGLPISVVDVDKLAAGGLRISVCAPGTRYVFNQGGQELDLGKLIALFDGEGPCACAVKDSQRTKTHDGTTRTLSVIWGTKGLPARTEAVLAWYRLLLSEVGATTELVELRVTAPE